MYEQKPAVALIYDGLNSIPAAEGIGAEGHAIRNGNNAVNRKELKHSSQQH
ncbi:hypothetical protein OAL14_08205 [Gammaproteobacteria bacterium]|nr:hypothetical protein [Gammaproteobacteria bacterium]